MNGLPGHIYSPKAQLHGLKLNDLLGEVAAAING